jgi:hypothetical protein
MKNAGQIRTAGSPERTRWRSMSPCQRGNSSGESTAAAEAESFTSRRTPAALAASMAQIS